MVNRRWVFTVIACLLADLAKAGAWGPGSFENDGALDWILEFEKTPTVELVRDSLSRVGVGGNVDLLEGQSALAAAEVVAAAAIGSTEHLPKELRGRVAKLAARLKQLIPLARSATQRVAGPDSELAELWGEREVSRRQWEGQVQQLLRRLAQNAA